MSEGSPNEEASKGQSTHQRIVARALTLASTLGLESLTIGALSADLEMSKSGLFRHFNSKEKLQLDVLDAAADHFRTTVFLPALKVARGEPRLEAIYQHWIAWVRSKELPGGCIFLAGAAEWDDREGPVRDKLVLWFQALQFGLIRATGLAVEERHFRRDLDLEQFASEMHGIVMKYHLDARLVRNKKAEKHARAAFDRLVKDARCVRHSPSIDEENP